MRRIVAAFDDAEDATAAEEALRDAGFDPEVPDVDNAFMDPIATVPEKRGLLWGGAIGGVVGAVLLLAMAGNVFWVPRASPIMTAGPYALVVLGFGLGVACGGFVGGVIGTYRRVPRPDGPRIAVTIPESRIGETTDLLRSHGASEIGETVTHHEHPLGDQLRDSGTS